MEHLIWLIPALPLAGFVVLVFGGKRLGEPLAGWLATAAVAGSFLATVGVFLTLEGRSGEERALTQTVFTWLPAGGLHVDVGFLADPLSVTMCLFVTGVAALIHLYSIGYMHGDPQFSKFFVYLNLFVFSMLMLVLGDNLLVTFLGWEGVGACSYFLVSFWHENEANASAGKKAFVTNRIGDFGFMVAIFFTFNALGTLDYTRINATTGALSTTTATVIAAMLFLGACGKSAQLPLFVWLPDAMAGPTPVSALIHAATMVTAGVYLLTRMSPVLAVAAGWVPWLIAIIGALTALFAATVALAQNDIKRVLAYSTISQLGYMFLAVGSGAYVAAIFHMVTHAFFKALLFLGSGSVIHGMGDEQDMRRMGALRKVMPITAATFIVGWLAIAGVPPFAGFWSKDEVLLFAFHKSPVLWAIGLVTAILTAFYMSRQVILTFWGDARWNAELHPAAPGPVADEAGQSAAEVSADAEEWGPVVTAHASLAVAEGADAIEVHPHESGWKMTLPLVVLAGLATVGGFLNTSVTSTSDFLGRWLEPVVSVGEVEASFATSQKWALAVIATVGALAGIVAALAVYYRDRTKVAEAVEQPFFAHGWFYDLALSRFTGGPGREAFDGVAWFDANGIDGAVSEVANGVRATSAKTRLLQSGYVRNYAVGVALGAVVIAGLIATKAVL
ncbi:MAG: NADH-quinone oxidoreductase subunit L [Acidimicrobiales bacterium]